MINIKTQFKFLSNDNGSDYLILAEKKSKHFFNNNGNQMKDYLLKSKSGRIIIARGWDPVSRTWARGEYYSDSSDSILKALTRFKY